MPYQHDRDLPCLRAILRVINQQDGVGPDNLKKHYDSCRSGGGETTISIATMQRMMGTVVRFPTAGKNKPVAAGELYRFLFSKQPYRMRALQENNGIDGLADTTSPDGIEPGDGSLAANLSRALQGFLLTEEDFDHKSMKTIRTIYPGKYVMYRADLRPYAMKTESKRRFRATSVEIYVQAGTVYIAEIQDLPQIEEQDELQMKTIGVMFPYGRFFMFLVHAQKKESFRVGVIREHYTFVNTDKVKWFRGTILVASEADLFPSTRFFCAKDNGTLRTGRLLLSEIPNSAARSYLKDAHRIAEAHYEFSLDPVINS